MWVGKISGNSCWSSLFHKQEMKLPCEHLLLFCPALQTSRDKMFSLLLNTASNFPPVQKFLFEVLFSSNYKTLAQFLVDCSVLPDVILLQQSYGQEPLRNMFYVSRNWCYSIHHNRMNLLGLTQFRWICLVLNYSIS